MKKITILISLIIIISACEKDDFCTLNPVTSKLILRFYDNADKGTLKKVERLSIWADGKDTISAYKNISTDSVVLPLNSLATETVYHLKINGAITNNTALFTIKYMPKEEYISRSCGYRILFNDVTFLSSPNTWIKDFTPSIVTTINNQNAAHVQVFH